MFDPSSSNVLQRNASLVLPRDATIVRKRTDGFLQPEKQDEEKQMPKDLYVEFNEFDSHFCLFNDFKKQN